jgi:hypothetical protein
MVDLLIPLISFPSDFLNVWGMSYAQTEDGFINWFVEKFLTIPEDEQQHLLEILASHSIRSIIADIIAALMQHKEQVLPLIKKLSVQHRTHIILNTIREKPHLTNISFIETLLDTIESIYQDPSSSQKDKDTVKRIVFSYKEYYLYFIAKYLEEVLAHCKVSTCAHDKIMQYIPKFGIVKGIGPKTIIRELNSVLERRYSQKIETTQMKKALHELLSIIPQGNETEIEDEDLVL